MSDVVTVRIDRQTKQKIRKHGINVSKTVRAALKSEIRKHEDGELREALHKAGQILRKIPDKEIVRAVRESRDER
jgi:post-segregation antitoxin (ccd killing protein)